MIDPARVVQSAPQPARVQRSRVRDLLKVVLAAAVVALIVWFAVFARPSDPHMSAAATARALKAKVGHGPYVCHRLENTDHTIVGMKDVDFLCDSVHPIEFGYFVGTDSHRITDLQPTG